MTARAWLLAFFLSAAALHAAPETPPRSRAEIGERLRFYSDRISGFEQVRERVLAWTRLARRVCHDQPALGTDLLTRAAEQIVLMEGYTYDIDRNFLITAASACGPQLARQIAERSRRRPADEAGDSIDLLLNSARLALSEAKPEKGVAALREAMAARDGALFRHGAASPFGLGNFMAILNQLRDTDVYAADSVFVDAMRQLGTTQQVEGDTLLTLGRYVFALDPERPRPVSGEIAAEYVTTALNALLPVAHASTSRTDVYTALQQLLPKVRELVPERTAEVEAQLELMRSALPAGFIPQQRDLWNPAREAIDESAIHEFASEDALIWKLLNVVASLTDAKKFDQARSAAERITHAEVRDAMMRSVTYGEASIALARGNIERVEELSAKLPAGPERCLLRIAIAAGRARKDRIQGIETIFVALQDVRNIEAPGPLLLSAANVLAPLDPNAAFTVLQQAVTAINDAAAQRRLEADERLPHPRKVRVRYRGDSIGITLPYAGRGWTLTGGEAGIGAVTAALARVDFEMTERIVLAISDESELAQALDRLAEALLRTPRRPHDQHHRDDHD